MSISIRPASRGWLLLGLVALVACGTPIPSVVPSSATAAPPSSSAATQSPEAASTVVPVSPSPVALEPRGVEVFDVLQSGHWEMAASESNFRPAPVTTIIRTVTEFVEVNAACTGNGTLVVRLNGAPQGQASDAPAPTSMPLMQMTVECPDTDGLSYSMAGGAPAGWFVIPDSTPSDPSITYEVLVGTIVD